MTRDDFHFIVPEVCSKSKTIQELTDVLTSLIVSGYNVGDELRYRINDYLSYSQNEDILWNEFIPKKGILVPNDNVSFHENEICNILILINSISSSNLKGDTLVEWFKSSSSYRQELFLKFIHLTFSSIFTFDATVKIFDKVQETIPENIYTLEYILTKLEEIGFDTESKPKAKIEEILKLYTNSNSYMKSIIKYILSRKLDIGLNEKSFFTLLNPLCSEKRILLVPYQRCEKEDKIGRIKFPCVAQLKADGKFQNIIFDGVRGIGLAINRSGMRSNLKIFQYFNQFNMETGYFNRVWPGVKFTLTGEALVKKPGENIAGKGALDIDVYERKTGNGLLNSYGNRYPTFKTLFEDVVKVIGTPKVLKKLEKLISQLLEWKYVEDNTIFQLWNMFPADNWLNLNTGFDVAKAFNYCNDFIINYNQWIATKGLDTNLIIIHNEIFEDLDSVYDLYYRVLDKGMEGLVVKNLDAIIEHGTCTTGIIKLKDFKECDLRVIGFEPGTGRYLGGIGSLICTTECGRMTVSVAGLKMIQRGFIRVDMNNSAAGVMLDPDHENDKFNGKIVNVKYNAISQDKNGEPSLSLPSVVEVRDDVVQATFFHELKK